MILVGQYDSPYVRRVAISLKRLGVAYEQDTRSVFGDFGEMLTVNPLARIPSLVLDSGQTLIDSFAILDWLDREVGHERALLPVSGAARTEAMQTIALATGAIDKLGAVNYEAIIRPEALRWPDWMERLRTQGLSAVAALEKLDWSGDAFPQTHITTGCLLGYLALTQPRALADFPKLSAFWARCSAMPEFAGTATREYGVPHG